MRKHKSEKEKSGVAGEQRAGTRRKRNIIKETASTSVQEAQVMEEERGWMEAKSPSIPSPCTGQLRGGV